MEMEWKTRRRERPSLRGDERVTERRRENEMVKSHRKR